MLALAIKNTVGDAVKMNYAKNTIERVLNRDEIIVAGHRGMKAIYPENTLLGIMEALHHGVDMIEIDLNLSKDKVVIVMHDNSVDRTTNGTGNLRDLTLSEIKSLDAGSFLGKEFEGLKVPTLEELCNMVAPFSELLFNVEIKEKTFETVDLSFRILKDFGLMERCVFTCFDANIVHYMVDTYGVKVQGFPKEYMENFIDGENGTYSKLFAVGIAMRPFPDKPEMRTLSPELVKEFEAMGIEPWCFCPDNDLMVEEAIRCGVRLMTCNDPLPALRILHKCGMHRRNICKP